MKLIIVFIAILACFSVASASMIEVTVCQGSNVNMFCPRNHQIKILTVFWGRDNRDICDVWKEWNKKCKSSVAFGIVTTKCNGKESCHFVADTWTLKNPCWYTTEYFRATYICQSQGPEPTGPSVIQKTVCDDFISFMSCQVDGQIMKVVAAEYTDKDSDYTCPSSQNTALLLSHNGVCRKDITLMIKQKCENQRVCVVEAKKNDLRHLCQQKSYIMVTYYCLGGVTVTTQAPRTVVPPVGKVVQKQICEGQSSIVTCFTGVIHIKSSWFGRKDKHVCQDPYNNKNSQGSCYTDTLDFARFTCQNKKMCVLNSDASVYGDPCKGVAKYLEYEFQCLPTTPHVVPTQPYIPKVPKFTGQPGSKGNRQCGRPTAMKSRVINGKDTFPGAWPWTVAIYRNNGGLICGGTLIDAKWIVTATHCFQKAKPDNYYVVLGEFDRTKIEGHEFRHDISRIILHRWYASSVMHENDIALVELKKPGIFGTYIKPACLPSKNDSPRIGERCFISGWGKIKFPGYSHTKMQQAQLPVLDRYECETKLKSAPGKPGESVTNNMVCTGSQSGQSACHGDSGGPFVCQQKSGEWILKGVVSWGSARCDTGDMYSVMTDVSKYIDWINWHRNN